MFISNISQNQSTKFSFKSNIQKCFPARELILEKLDNNLAKQLGVKVPTTKDEQKTVVSKVYEQLHMIMLSGGKQFPILRNFRMPCTQEEKDAQIEFLKNRKLLDKWAQLVSKMSDLIMTRNLLSHLKYDNPKISKETKDIFIPHIPQMEQELEKAGDFEAALRSLNSQISYEEMSNPKAVEYFKNLEKLKAIYKQNGLITEDMEENYWQILEDESINKTNLSVGQLLELVQKHSKVQTSSAQLTKAQKAEIKAQKKAAEAARKAQIEAAKKARNEAAQKLEKQKQAEKAACAPKEKIKTNQTKQSVAGRVEVQKNGNKYLTRKQLLETAKKEFELYLRKNIDFYKVMNDNFILSQKSKSGIQQDVVTISITSEAKKAHDRIYDTYQEQIDKYRANDELLKLFAKVLNTYRMNAGKIGNMVLEMRNVGAYWRYMERDGIVELKGYKDKIDNLEQKLKLNDADKSLIKEYSQIKVRLLNESDYVEALNDVKTKLADDTLSNQPELAEKLVLLKRELEKTVQYNKRFAVLEKMLKSVKGNEKELRELIDTEYKMAENKYIWTQYLERAVEAETFNRQSASEQKCIGIYNYITGENASIKNYRALDEIRIENEGKLPEEIWDRILTHAGEDGSLSKEAWAKILE